MKIVYILLAVIIIGAGFYLATSSSTSPTPEPDTTDTTVEITETETDTEASVDSTMPALDSTTEEMVVESEAEVDATDTTTADTKVFTVTGVNYAFDVEEIRVNEGDTVTINFESTEGFHDWVVDEFDAATEKVRPGTPTSVTFVADTAGTYEYYCSVGQHRAQGMVGTLIVE